MSNSKAKGRLRHAAPVFAALGDDLRLSMVARLSQGAPLSITRLAAGLPVTRQAVTKHLRVLEGAGLVRSRKHGREQHWEFEPDSLREARECLDTISRQWSNTLGRLKAFVETQE